LKKGHHIPNSTNIEYIARKIINKHYNNISNYHSNYQFKNSDKINVIMPKNRSSHNILSQNILSQNILSQNILSQNILSKNIIHPQFDGINIDTDTDTYTTNIKRKSSFDGFNIKRKLSFDRAEKMNKAEKDDNPNNNHKLFDYRTLNNIYEIKMIFDTPLNGLCFNTCFSVSGVNRYNRFNKYILTSSVNEFLGGFCDGFLCVGDYIVLNAEKIEWFNGVYMIFDNGSEFSPWILLRSM